MVVAGHTRSQVSTARRTAWGGVCYRCRAAGSAEILSVLVAGDQRNQQVGQTFPNYVA